MKIVRNKSGTEDFTITNRVLLLFNEHDARIALNWGNLLPGPPIPQGDTPTTATSIS